MCLTTGLTPTATLEVQLHRDCALVGVLVPRFASKLEHSGVEVRWWKEGLLSLDRRLEGRNARVRRDTRPQTGVQLRWYNPGCSHTLPTNGEQSSGHSGRSACCAAAEVEAASALAAAACIPPAAAVVACAASTVPACGPSAAPAAAASSAPAAASSAAAALAAVDTSPSGGATLARHTGHSGLVSSQASTQAAWNVWPQPGRGLRGGASGGSGADEAAACAPEQREINATD